MQITENQNKSLSQLDKLKMLQIERKRKEKQSNMIEFNDLIGIYVGAETKEHYPKLKDGNGKTIKDEKGRDKRSDDLDGYTHIFSQFGTSKMIQVVLSKEYKLDLMTAYKIKGFGYDIKNSMFFIEKNAAISPY